MFDQLTLRPASALRPATAQVARSAVQATADKLACEQLKRSNMARYDRVRGIAWDPARFEQSWLDFENTIIEGDGLWLGTMAVLQINANSAIGDDLSQPQGSVAENVLELRDLQLKPEFQNQGVGTWAMHQFLAMAKARNIHCLRLRVYPENPALRLYLRFGFHEQYREGEKLHMQRSL